MNGCQSREVSLFDIHQCTHSVPDELLFEAGLFPSELYQLGCVVGVETDHLFLNGSQFFFFDALLFAHRSAVIYGTERLIQRRSSLAQLGIYTISQSMRDDSVRWKGKASRVRLEGNLIKDARGKRCLYTRSAKKRRAAAAGDGVVKSIIGYGRHREEDAVDERF